MSCAGVEEEAVSQARRHAGRESGAREGGAMHAGGWAGGIVQ